MKACKNHFITKLDTGEFIAVSLGFAVNEKFEDQVSGIKRTFGMKETSVPGKQVGIENMRIDIIQNIPIDSLLFGSVTAFEQEYSCLICSPTIASNLSEISVEELRECDIELVEGKEMYTSWGEGGFAIVITGELSRYAASIYEALRNKNAMVSLNSSDDMTKGLTILRLGSFGSMASGKSKKMMN